MPSFDKNPTVGDVCRWFQKKVPLIFSSQEAIRRNVRIDPAKIAVVQRDRNYEITVKSMAYNKPTLKGKLPPVKSTKDIIRIVLTGFSLKDHLILDNNRSLPEVEIEEAYLLCYLVVTGVFYDESKRELFLNLVKEV
jgi:hypothetical protein